jgi:aryl-alcohol dehydrogenase-like predicted oxidoreductase
MMGTPGLTLGGTVKGDPVKEIVKTAFDHGINFIDTAESMSEFGRFAGSI